MSEEKQVGIVLVSHSGPVAEAVAELAKGLAAGGATAPVAAAGGTPSGALGTATAALFGRAVRSKGRYMAERTVNCKRSSATRSFTRRGTEPPRGRADRTNS